MERNTHQESLPMREEVTKIPMASVPQPAVFIEINPQTMRDELPFQRKNGMLFMNIEPNLTVVLKKGSLTPTHLYRQKDGTALLECEDGKWYRIQGTRDASPEQLRRREQSEQVLFLPANRWRPARLLHVDPYSYAPLESEGIEGIFTEDLAEGEMTHFENEHGSWDMRILKIKRPTPDTVIIEGAMEDHSHHCFRIEDGMPGTIEQHVRRDMQYLMSEENRIDHH